jgi:hypothetical protein
MIYVQKLKTALELQGDEIWVANSEILVWLLVIGSMQSFSLEEEHEWFVAALAKYVAGIGCGVWGGIRSLNREVLWLEDVFEVECHRLRGEVSIKSWQLHQHPFS